MTFTPIDEWRVVRQPSGTVDTSVYDVRPLTDAFEETASGGVLSLRDSDGTTIDEYPRGQRIQVQYSTDGGSTWSTRKEGLVQNATPNKRDGRPQVDLDWVAYDHLLRRRKVYKSYTSSSISTILNDLVTGFTAVDWVAANVTVTNDKTISREFKGERVDEAIAYLAGESADEEWYVNDSLEFVFQEQDAQRAPPIADRDLLEHDLPREGKRAINRFKLFYGPSGSRAAVVVEDKERQSDLKDKLGASRGVEISESDTYPEVSNEDRAEAIARQRLEGRDVIRTGTVTLPVSRPETNAGDVVELTVSEAGISQADYRVAQVEYNWQDGETVLTVAENRGNVEDLLVALSDSLDNVRAREADPGATVTKFHDPISGVTASITGTLTTKERASGAFALGQSQLGQGTGDTLGGGVASTADVGVESAKVTRPGLNMYRDVWQGDAYTDHSHLGTGTNDAAATRADSSLEAPVDRVSMELFSTGNQSDRYEYVATVPAGGPYGDAGGLAEVMVFDSDIGGTGYLRLTHADASLDAATRLKVHIEVTVDTDTELQGVVTSTGQERLRDLYVGESGHEPATMLYGEGTADATESDTALGNQQHSDAIDSTADRSTGLSDIVERITSSEADTTDFSEVGYENSSNELLARVAHEPYADDFILETNYRFRARNA